MLLFIKSLPEIIGFLMELKKLFDEGLHNYEKQKVMADLTLATKKARETKDTSDLESVLRNVVNGL